MQLAQDFTIGLEEELFLVDGQSYQPCQRWPEPLVEFCSTDGGQSFTQEYLRAQIELVTRPHAELAALSADYLNLRQRIVTKASAAGVAVMAASTHPEAQWREQSANTGERYDLLQESLQITADRLLVAGMHIHIGVMNPKKRLTILNHLIPYLPIVLALTSSSPFWGGYDTGLNSYRVSVLSNLPRAGLPPVFDSLEAYEGYVTTLVDAGLIKNARELWWDARLSARFPTIEVRLADTCTSSKDSLSVVALLQTLVRYIARQLPNDPNLHHNVLLSKDNRWLAQRYSLKDGYLLSPTSTRGQDSFQTIISRLLEVLLPDANALGVASELSHCETILHEGTSADKQRVLYYQKRAEGLSEKQALREVSRYLVRQTSVQTAVSYVELDVSQ